LEKTPRVFLSEHAQFSTVTENYSEPVIILKACILDRFREPAELRFIIGRELGHVKTGHTRWNTLVRWMKSFADRLSIFGETDTCLPLLPLLRWGREAEMTADNAGVICAQDQQAAERVVVRLATGVDEHAGHIDVDAFLQQSNTEKLSGFSEFALLWQEWNRPTPFAPSRIRQFRQFRESSRYKALWD
jgi:Zn-dependent protease with chaperone function